MFLFVPPIVNIDNTVTQVKHSILDEYTVTSTCLENAYHIMPDDFQNEKWIRKGLYTADLQLESREGQNTSTWEESIKNEFDLFTHVNFKKVIRVKSKIKLISKYKPNIILN